MDAKITLPRLAAIMAQHSGLKKKVCEDFLRELFNIISDSLENGDAVKIKEFGTFKLLAVESRRSVNVATGKSIEIPAHHKISFTPAKELAAIVNTPFEIFEATVIEDHISNQDIDNAAEEQTAALQSELSDTPTPDDNHESIYDIDVPEENIVEEIMVQHPSNNDDNGNIDAETVDNIDEYNVENNEVVETLKPITEEITVVESQAVKTAEETEKAQEEEEEEEDITTTSEKMVEAELQKKETAQTETSQPETKPVYKRHYWVGKGFVAGFLSAIALVAIIFVGAYLFDAELIVISTSNKIIADNRHPDAIADNGEKGTVTDTASIAKLSPAPASPANVEVTASVSEDKISEKEIAPTKPSDSPVYDTITKTRYLTTMARQHYGNYHLWPYIYEENKAILGHPDRIRPGTKVVIPKLSKYGVDPNNPDDITKAKNKGAAIYARYR